MQLFGKWENTDTHVIFAIENGSMLMHTSDGQSVTILEIMRLGNNFVASLGTASVTIPIVDSNTIAIGNKRYMRVGHAVTPIIVTATNDDAAYLLRTDVSLSNSLHSVLGGLGWAIGAALI